MHGCRIPLRTAKSFLKLKLNKTKIKREERGVLEGGDLARDVLLVIFHVATLDEPELGVKKLTKIK
jgi:hypothetical protein